MNDEVDDEEGVIYGMLVLLGCNGVLPGGDKGRRRSRFILRQRPEANGLRTTRNQRHVDSLKAIQMSDADNEPHAAVSYTLGRNKGFMVVEYEKDTESDMFQIGRSAESCIDFIVGDMVPVGDSARKESTISRFACRVVVDRNFPHEARIFAAGFDSQKHIVLGENAIRWNLKTGDLDGLTTNGVLISRPNPGFCPDSEPGPWYEVSIEGRLYPMRESRACPSHSEVLSGVDNLLHDGTVIDLCGCCLLWRSAEGLKCSPSLYELSARVDSLNRTKIQCPVQYQTLQIKSPSDPEGFCVGANDRQPYVYIGCGHVHGAHSWNRDEGNAPGSRTCPLCLRASRFVPLQLGSEPAFYPDREGMPNFAFFPCGHMSSELTVRYWGALPLLSVDSNELRPRCPFCGIQLDAANPGVRLIFQSDL